MTDTSDTLPHSNTCIQVYSGRFLGTFVHWVIRGIYIKVCSTSWIIAYLSNFNLGPPTKRNDWHFWHSATFEYMYPSVFRPILWYFCSLGDPGIYIKVCSTSWIIAYLSNFNLSPPTNRNDWHFWHSATFEYMYPSVFRPILGYFCSLGDPGDLHQSLLFKLNNSLFVKLQTRAKLILVFSNCYQIFEKTADNLALSQLSVSCFLTAKFAIGP